MNDSVALRRYLQRHMEKGLPDLQRDRPLWRQALVLPAYREAPALLDTLRQLPGGPGRSLVILVLNRPDRDGDAQANDDLRRLVRRQLQRAASDAPLLLPLNEYSDLFLLDLETLAGPTPSARGVGLARKAGCDLALKWMAQGAISGEWIYCTDADALLPDDYFDRTVTCGRDAVAAVFPFQHVTGGDSDCDRATALYELRLHHHVLGLEYAGSPYAYHSLGSCLAFRGAAYAQVRGFPRRAAAEDFYLLNKLNKLGAVARIGGEPVRLRSRLSDRVPFGTGPAVRAIAAEGEPRAAAVFYHPHCYDMLRAVLGVLPRLATDPALDLAAALGQQGLSPGRARQVHDTLLALGLRQCLAHCRRQARSSGQFQHYFHEWFDAFVVLKFIHALRDDGWPMQSLAQLDALEPGLWPSPEQDFESLRAGVAQHWNWQLTEPRANVCLAPDRTTARDG